MFVPVFRSEPVNWKRAKEIHESSGDPLRLSNFGPLVQKLEADLASLLNVNKEKLVIFSSGTEALSASIATISGRPKTLSIPDFSFVATLRAAQNTFEGSIFVEDLDLEDWALRRTRGDSKVFMPVCIFGASPLPLMKKFSGEKAIFDAAASLGSTPDLSGMEKNHCVSFSLHSTKILGSGEGGFTVYGTETWAEEARAWSNFGRSDNREFRAKGANAKMSEVQAAFVLAQLEVFSDKLINWKRSQYLAKESTMRLGFEHHVQAFEDPNPYWVVRFRSTGECREAERLLANAGIESRRWWPKSLAELNSQDQPPFSRKLRETTLGLPMFLGISDEEISLVEKALGPIPARIKEN